MLEWTDKYASGSSLVDEQHKELFRRVNLLLASCDEGKGKLEVQRTLEFIREYVQFHFSTEEQLMRKYNFPERIINAAKPLKLPITSISNTV